MRVISSGGINIISATAVKKIANKLVIATTQQPGVVGICCCIPPIQPNHHITCDRVAVRTVSAKINLKCYQESIGHSAHRIAKAAREVSDESGVCISIAPLFMDIHPIKNHFNLPVFAQHIDPITPGAHTGRIPLAAVKAAGAIGSLVNHSEYRLSIADIEKNITALRSEGMISCVCSNTIGTTSAIASLGPDFVAIEPPELIGGKISVSESNPDIITGSVQAALKSNPEVQVLTGAGIHSGKCVKTAIELGTAGVLLASSVVKAEDPASVLRDLVSLL